MLTAKSFDVIVLKTDINQFFPKIEALKLLSNEDVLRSEIWELKNLLENQAKNSEIIAMITRVENSITIILWSIKIGGDDSERLRGSQSLIVHSFLQKIKWLYKQELVHILQKKSPAARVQPKRKSSGKKKELVVETNQQTSVKNKFWERLFAVTLENDDLSMLYDDNQTLFSDLGNSQKIKSLCTKLKRYILWKFSSIIYDEQLSLEFFEGFDRQIVNFLNEIHNQIDWDPKKYFIDSFDKSLLEKFKNACLEVYDSSDKWKRIAKK